jgi:ATP adenylyltransferase
MPEILTLIEPGTLAQRLEVTRQRALELGALQPIASRETRINDSGVTFLVRQVDSLARKAVERPSEAAPQTATSPRPSPFLPPEPELTLGALSATHFAVLNKFNVLDSHLLMVTRQLEDQETLLTIADMEALARCLVELDGLAFYNGGRAAGASQTHKHLQLVPLPLEPDHQGVPMEPLLQTRPGDNATALPFDHAFAPLQADSDAAELHRVYLDLLRRIGIRPLPGQGKLWQSGPYNLLATRRWMLAVPRQTESVDGISMNALGFAGSLFVKDEAGLSTVRQRGPMALLCAAAGTREET